MESMSGKASQHEYAAKCGRWVQVDTAAHVFADSSFPTQHPWACDVDGQAFRRSPLFTETPPSTSNAAAPAICSGAGRPSPGQPACTWPERSTLVCGLGLDCICPC